MGEIYLICFSNRLTFFDLGVVFRWKVIPVINQIGLNSVFSRNTVNKSLVVVPPFPDLLYILKKQPIHMY